MTPTGRRRVLLTDVARESLASMAGDAVRAALTVAGVVLGCAAYVTVSGMSATLANQVSDEFDALRATQVTVTAAAGTDAQSWHDDDDLERVRELPGVVDAGVLGAPVTYALTRPLSAAVREAEVRQVDAAALRVIAPTVGDGRAFGAFQVDSRSPVVLLSRAVADRLEIGRVGGTVTLDGNAFTVIGIFDDVQRRDELLLQALVPLGSLAPVPDEADAQPEVFVETEPGAASAVAAVAALVLHPEDPRVLTVPAPVDPSRFRRRVEGDVARLAVGVALVALVMGTVTIANAATATMYSRTSEIGLRGVLGALPRHVFGQLIGETAVLGLCGGLVGGAVGLTVVAGAALWQGWAPVVDLANVGLAVAVATAAGLVAGLAPALRATRIRPVDALRR